ncbi:hypothetical protein [Tateyamaria sp. SN6-1]|uniref:hypothetical protein n=1 Tax=Tateyamaria sp. SN6-1 TaxID=3092148 RepID=UPI0039F56659
MPALDVRHLGGAEVKGTATFDGPLATAPRSLRAERRRCSACGSPILYRLRLIGHTLLSQGAFDDQTGWTRVRKNHAEDKPDHYAFSPVRP